MLCKVDLRDPKCECVKQHSFKTHETKLLDLKEEINKSTSIVCDYKTTLATIYRKTRPKNYQRYRTE